ncbi:unnamed protein product [Ilex paraguariensis]|uniref:Wall-associated receptor kinase galacturonan-binding domain-containing protein n=1 Tax=Ilex paraguariensis TaxID=185542 RepID=A0ABC8QXU4_9AQUA
MDTLLLITTLSIVFQTQVPLVHSYGHDSTCRSYCGNITLDYPFSLQSGCGHPGFQDLLFCINDVLMFHIISGSYRVLDIDYAYQSLTLHDPHLSTCDSIVLGGLGNGFVVEQSRASYLNPTSDNVFMLIGCSVSSPLFRGFPGKHLPCRNVSGMGCEEYYECPAWNTIGFRRVGSAYGSGLPECCAVPFEGYSSAYSLAPLRASGPGQWEYGIRVNLQRQKANTNSKAGPNLLENPKCPPKRAENPINNSARFFNTSKEVP